ncbi:carboxylesterase 5A-like [Ostrinia furnacalis]|uniref:carboxylesterase 5A-like n=1 Tax=Ostrinia furnacalis TaxID=93504 RepID=UPI00103D2606|nr:carboxylesterase 5A-like [Ostrinia furnacalis]
MRAVQLLILFGLALQVFGQDFVVVNTSKGQIKGRDEGSYNTFFGIPYAKVDEENPFGVSLPYPYFTEPFNATDITISCPQVFRPQSIIQCLRLNIYVPKTTKKKLPVMVWIHGGAFIFGSGGDYGGQYLVQHDIIVVTINYRLGPYGFLCLDDPKVPGNQALKDQVDALKWVQQNIEAFGGDPKKVTVAGESYGGGSVDLLMYSNTEKLFDKAIVESGTAQEDAMFVKPDYTAAIKLAALFNYTACSTKDALKFLAQKDPFELMQAFNSSDILLRVCKEKKFKGVQSFLTDDSFHLYNPKKVKDTPVIFGYNSKEQFNTIANETDDFFRSLKDIIIESLNRTFNFNEEELLQVSSIVKKFYMGSKEIGQDTKLALGEFLTDFSFTHAAETSVTRLVDQGAKVYKYIFSYIGNSRYKNIHGVGAYHTEELQYLFGLGEDFGFDPLVEPEHLMMRDRMTTMWANFVKYGNLIPETSDLLPVQWDTVPKDSRPYMDIDVTMEMLEDVYHDRVAFWDLLWYNYWRQSKLLC